jgi:hypothetical protein
LASLIIALAGVVIAIAAVAVAVWQVSAGRKSVDRTNCLPVVSKAFDEFRSETFQGHLREVWRHSQDAVPVNGFQALPDDWRTSAYAVGYFFEYLGVLVAYKLVPKEFVIDFSSNLIARSWNALRPFIEAERTYRKRHAIDGVNPGFVSHFEHLAALTVDESGGGIDGVLHEKIGLKSVRNLRLLEEASTKTSEPAKPSLGLSAFTSGEERPGAWPESQRKVIVALALAATGGWLIGRHRREKNPERNP